MKARDPLSSLDPGGGPVVTPRFVAGAGADGPRHRLDRLLLPRRARRPDDLDPKTASPSRRHRLHRRPGKWNYVIGFGAFLLGLVISAHPSTPLGRGRGVVVGMLGCFLIGLLWICTYYVFSDDLTEVPVFNDLGQYNLMVGIASWPSASPSPPAGSSPRAPQPSTASVDVHHFASSDASCVATVSRTTSSSRRRELTGPGRFSTAVHNPVENYSVVIRLLRNVDRVS